jgi:8-oxo-dGTP diphosphatase
VAARRPGPELCVGAVVVDRGRLLLVRRANPPAAGRWSIPGGRVELGERMATAVERELAEETGLRGRCGDLIGWVERTDPPHHYVIVDFRVGLIDPPEAATAGDDAAEVAWVALGDVAGHDLVPGLAGFLADYGIIAGGS